MKQYNNTNVIERVAKLEERVNSGFSYIKEELKEIKDNHLHTLQKDVQDLKIQVNTLAVKLGIAVAVIMTAIELVSRYFIR